MSKGKPPTPQGTEKQPQPGSSTFAISVENAVTAGLKMIDVASASLDYVRVPADFTSEGAPLTGTLELESFAGADVGIWEMTQGGMRDIEAEELFVVTAGEADVVIHHSDGTDQTVHLRPGALVRFCQGLKTTWKVTTPLRKVYFLASPTGSSE